MSVLVVDDEPMARARLLRMLAQVGGYRVCAEAGDGAEALQMALEHQPDLVLLDIRMPPPDGVEVAAALNRQARPPAIIFCTAYDEYALPAFDAAAVDYLVKPIKQARLEQALARVTRLSRAQLAQLAEQTQSQENEQFPVRSYKGVSLIPVAEIRCFIAEDKYVTLVHSGGTELVDTALRELEQEFEGRFLRVHRNALVARRYITALEKGADGRYFVCLSGVDIKPEVSRRQMPVLRHILTS